MPSEGTNWTLIGGGIVGLLALVGIGAFFLRSGSDGEGKKGKHRVKFSETQIDDYKLVNLMMTGQTSQVWDASELSSGRHFALKLLLPEHARLQQHRYFLFHEYEVGKQISHPKIIRMFKLVRDRDYPYLLMEFFPSTNLKLRLMHKEKFIWEHINDIVEFTAMGMSHMHSKGWVHRDLKPDNILFSSAGDLRLIDFALARRLEKRKKGLFRKRKSGKAQGTRTYMSPEQIRAEPLDARADLYSFGVSLYELLTWRPPFRADSPQQLLHKQLYEKPQSPQVHNPDLTNEISDLILAMLAKKPDDRPRDFDEFLSKFKRLRVFKSVAPVRKKAE